jgi:hypothetical protein
MSNNMFNKVKHDDGWKDSLRDPANKSGIEPASESDADAASPDQTSPGADQTSPKSAAPLDPAFKSQADLIFEKYGICANTGKIVLIQVI